MANFIPNFNAPSQNYGNILNMSYRRGMDPRKRRRIASGRPAGTQVITNPDGTQVSVSGQTARQASNAARRESRAKRVAEVAASQKRTKPSDILKTSKLSDGSEFMEEWSRQRDSEGNLRGTQEFSEAATRPKPQRAAVRFDPSWEFAQGRGPVARPNPNPNAPGSPLVATPSQQFANTRRLRQNEAMARKVSRDLENFKDSTSAQTYGTQVLDPKLQPQFISDMPFPYQGRGKGMGGVPAVNEAVARMAMSPEDRRYLDEQDRQRKMAGLLYSAPTGLYNYLFGD